MENFRTMNCTGCQCNGCYECQSANCDIFTLPDIARYETDEQGNGAFYPGDEDKPYIGYGLVVNAWMPLPKPYREEEEAAVDETTQKTDTGAERTDNIK